MIEALSPERLRVLFCDHLNIVRGKYVPWRGRDGAARFCRGTFGVGYDKDLIPAPGATVLEGLPDMEAVYEAAAARPGWERNTRVVMCDLLDNHGQPLPQCARGALKRAIAGWHALGYEPMVGIELEAYAFQIEPDGSLKPYDTPSSHVYATGPFADPRGFTDALWEQAAACGLPIDSLNTEYDAPQYELTLTFDSALKAVDDIVLFRLLAREVAFRHGILLSFLPKPLPAQGGSGVHVNFSFRHREGPQAGRNAFSGGADASALNELTRGCIAGLMQHHRAIAGLAALKRPCRVRLTTDSEYLKKGMTEWLAGWLRRGWKNSQKQPVANRDLWEQLLELASIHQVEWHWVRGHTGHVENERCDALARAAIAAGRSK